VCRIDSKLRAIDEKKNNPGKAVAHSNDQLSRPPVLKAIINMIGIESASLVIVTVGVEAEIPRMINGPTPHDKTETLAAKSGISRLTNEAKLELVTYERLVVASRCATPKCHLPTTRQRHRSLQSLESPTALAARTSDALHLPLEAMGDVSPHLHVLCIERSFQKVQMWP
jgi:hypothetical protein